MTDLASNAMGATTADNSALLTGLVAKFDYECSPFSAVVGVGHLSGQQWTKVAYGGCFLSARQTVRSVCCCSEQLVHFCQS